MREGSCRPADRRDLPTVDGAGLEWSELCRVTGAANVARYEYGVTCPEAAWSPGEADRRAHAAATAELRRVLRDRWAPAPRVCA